MKSLAQEYMERYGIDLAAALLKLQRKHPKKAMVGPSILEWTHMLGAAAQLLCAAKSKKIKECMPTWLEEKLATILHKYGPYADAMDLARFEVCAQASP